MERFKRYYQNKLENCRKEEVGKEESEKRLSTMYVQYVQIDMRKHWVMRKGEGYKESRCYTFLYD